MSGILPYAIWAGIILVVLGLIAMLLFGLRSVFYGKIEPISLGLMVIPILIFVVLGFTMETWARGAIMTSIVLFGLGIVGLFLTGVRGLFT